jgi:hypothetical protein
MYAPEATREAANLVAAALGCDETLLDRIATWFAETPPELLSSRLTGLVASLALTAAVACHAAGRLPIEDPLDTLRYVEELVDALRAGEDLDGPPG